MKKDEETLNEAKKNYYISEGILDDTLWTELINKGLSEEKIFEYLEEKRLEPILKEMDKDVEEIGKNWDAEEYGYGEGFSGKLLKLWDKLFGN
mgnify:CR=1 FL=1